MQSRRKTSSPLLVPSVREGRSASRREELQTTVHAHCFRGENPSLSQHKQGGREDQWVNVPPPPGSVCWYKSRANPSHAPGQQQERAGDGLEERERQKRHKTVTGWLSPEVHRLCLSYSLDRQVTATSMSKCLDSTIPTCHH